ncbi:MAG: MFS transporter [Hyphomonadaceae bacterium]
MTPASNDRFLEALDVTPLGPAHRRLFVIVGAGLLVDSLDIFIVSGISSALLHQGLASLTQLSHLAAASAFGMALGALCGGVLGDRFGRRLIILVGSAVIMAGAAACAAAPSIETLIAARFVTALGLGVENVLAYGILIEFLPLRARGTWMTALALIATCAAPLALIMNYFVAPLPGGWRLLFATVAALSAVALTLRFALPESARWLAARGYFDRAKDVVTRFAPQMPISDAAGEPSEKGAAAPAHFGSETIVRLGVAGLLNVGLVVATFGFVSWLPTFFAEEGRELPSALLKTTIITLGAPVGVVIGLIVADRSERKWTTVVSAVAAAAAGVTYALAPAPALVPLGFLVVVTIYAFGAVGVTAYMPELFATPIRMRAVGFAISMGRFAAIVIPIATVSIFQRSGQAGVVMALAVALLIVAFVVAYFGVRTRDKPLDAI